MGGPDQGLSEPPIWYVYCRLVRLPRHHKSELLLPAPPRKGSLPGNHSGRNVRTADSSCSIAWAFTATGTKRSQCTAGTGYLQGIRIAIGDFVRKYV